MLFYVGLHQPYAARLFEHSMVSVNRLRDRRGGFPARQWIMDSGAFTEIMAHGAFRYGAEEYAAQIERFSECGELIAAVSQDYMCEQAALERTGLTVADHQLLTVERYAGILESLSARGGPAYLMPVLQGYTPEEYACHVTQYGSLLSKNAYVGVGSVCKRNASPGEVADVLAAIKAVRADLRLHGFGLKLTALADDRVRSMLHSSDSLAWSFSARRQGRDANDPAEAARYVERVRRQPVQLSMFPATGQTAAVATGTHPLQSRKEGER